MKNSIQPDQDMTSPEPGDSPRLGGPLVASAVVVMTFITGFILWGSLAPLESAAIANGVVVVDGSRKSVQHLEGGIVRGILARDGDRVEAGQVLVEIDPTRAQAGVELLKGRYLSALALEHRLRAEIDNKRKVSFPAALENQANDPRVKEIRESQRRIFIARMVAFREQVAILRQRKAQSEEEITGLKSQIRAENRQLDSIRSEMRDVAKLLKKGFARKSRHLALKRRAAEMEGRRDLHKAQIARVRQVIQETLLRVNGANAARLRDVTERLSAAQVERFGLEERLAAGRDVMRRTSIRAPISGTVVGLKIHTVGGVLEPGGTVMDIVPGDTRLIVEARVKPIDIDVVHQGLKAKVRFTAFNQRNTPPVEGIIASVSADRLTDENTGEFYYLARVEVRDQRTIRSLHPGMPAEVMIITDRRTLMGYLFEPLTKSLNRAFRES